MSPVTGFAVYFIVWWLTLFLVLPIGVRSQAEEGEVAHGTDPGAPARPRLGIRLAANTVLSAVLFGIWYWVTYRLGIGLDSLPSIFPQDR